MSPVCIFFTGLLETGVEDKQGKNVKPPCWLNIKKNCLVMSILCSLMALTFWKCPKLQQQQKKPSNLWICFCLLIQQCIGGCHNLFVKEPCCYQSCWLHTKLKYNRKSWFNIFTKIPQQDKTNRNTKTKEVRKVVSNRYSLVDIPNHAAGVEDGVWHFFILFSC